MASFPSVSRNAVLRHGASTPSSASPSRSCLRGVAGCTVVSCSGERADSRGSLMLKAARLLSPPTRFEPSKLNVVFLGEDVGKHSPSTVPRTYALTHCDFTANLNLSVCSSINIDQLRRWQTKLQKDDVVAEWKMEKDEVSLHVHCYVSGANLLQELAAEFRYYIFSKELPLVLQAVVHGDSVLFKENPDLLNASVWVYFHSNSRKYNRIECWGPLKDATQRTLDDQIHSSSNLAEERKVKWSSHRTIFQALVTLLL